MPEKDSRAVVIGAGSIGLLAAAALKHHFVDKDNTLTRMLGRRNAAASSLDNTEI